MGTKPQTKTFGRIVKEGRLAQGISQEELAEKTGVKRGTIACLEADKRALKGVQTWEALAEVFGWSAAQRKEYAQLLRGEK